MVLRTHPITCVKLNARIGTFSTLHWKDIIFWKVANTGRYWTFKIEHVRQCYTSIHYHIEYHIVDKQIYDKYAVYFSPNDASRLMRRRTFSNFLSWRIWLIWLYFISIFAVVATPPPIPLLRLKKLLQNSPLLHPYFWYFFCREI